LFRTEVENTLLTVLEQERMVRRKASRLVTVNNCIVCHAFVPNSDNVILATVDGTILTFDQVRYNHIIINILFEIYHQHSTF